jgi:hypothetical protein
MRPLRATTVKLCRADLSILKVIWFCRDALQMLRPLVYVNLQSKGQIQIIENGRDEARPDDGFLANAGFSGVERRELTATQK